MIRLSGALLMALVVAGCATQGVSNVDHVQSTMVPVKNEKEVEDSYSAVWDRLVRELSKSYFVINNIDKESRIINLSFISDDPSEYVDCGRTTRVYREGELTETVRYETAGPATFKVPDSRREHPAIVNFMVVKRTPKLEGRTNVYLAPVTNAPGKTTVSVNTRYVLSVAVNARAYAKFPGGSLQDRGSASAEGLSATFNTNTVVEARTNDNGPKITCFSKGRLEREILELAK